MYERRIKIATIYDLAQNPHEMLDLQYTNREGVVIMDLRDLLESARDAGIFTTISVPVSDVPDADRTVDFGTEDAYAHMAELAY